MHARSAWLFRRRWLLALGCVLVLAALGLLVALAKDEGRRPSEEPLAQAITSAARSHRVVLIGEIHGWSAEHRLLRELVTSSESSAVVDDIVVEFGNARYQGLVDAYVSGADVTEAEVSRAWLETTQGAVWSDPDYAAFFRAVREHNLRSPANRLRVVLGDPPLPRAGPRPGEEDFWILQRDAHLAYLIQREVLSRGRRALVVAGAGHVLRHASGVPTLTNLLEGRGTCATDPRSIAVGIDWCDDLRRYRPVSSVYVVVPAPAAAIDEIRTERSIAVGEVVNLARDPIGSVELARFFAQESSAPREPLRAAADALLAVGS